MGNRFTERLDAEDEFANEINEQEFLVGELKKEFPNDPVLQQGKLFEAQRLPTLPVKGLAKRNLETSLLEIDADVSASYAQYNINKMVPGVDDEELDEILDDEFEFYLDPNEGGFRAPATTGLFLISVEIDDRPFDFHDTYITSGPEQIPSFIARGLEDDDILRNVFCVWFIERDIARPIPNYKTLEVMLVERSLTYSDIGEADEDQMKQFDMRLDGRFKNYPEEDADGNPLSRPTIYDEFIAKSVIDRSKNWNATTRFKSNYTPGESSTGVPFLRDPGDYIKPNQLRGNATYIPELNKMVPARVAKLIEARRIELNNEDKNISDEKLVREFEKLRDPLEDADPDDKYFDKAFVTTRRERLRAEYEGKLILLQWPGIFNIDIIRNFSDNVVSDDLIFDLRFMLFGHLKQVVSLRTLKEIARINNVDTSAYDPVDEIIPPGEAGSDEFQAALESLDEEQFAALREASGLINVMVQQGAIEVLGDQRLETGTRAIWDDFGQIAQVDRLDFDEYDTYVTYESNNLAPFDITQLTPYEPAGSIAYYPAKRYDDMQQQAIAQGQFDQAKKAIEEMFPPVASKAAELGSRLSGIQGGFAQMCQDAFGPDSDIHQILFNSISSDGKTFELIKEKNNGTIKVKGRQESFFKLCEIEERILKYSMSKSKENKIFLSNGEISSAWFINTNDKDDYGRAQALLATRNSNGLVLCDDKMKDAMKKARTGTTPKFRRNDGGSAGDGKQRYARPERGGSRVRQQMKDEHYFRAGVAQYILEFIIDPRQYQSQSDSLPTDLINGNDTADLYTLCIDADDFLVNIQQDITEINEFIAGIDERILNADSVDELLDIEAKLRNGKNLVEDFNIELFTYLESLQDYINNQKIELITRIVNAIQHVRKCVNDKNDKYYILWAPENAAIAAAYTSVDMDSYKRD
jgi:hypothetical protein